MPSDAEFWLQHGNAFPYDAPREWWEGDGLSPPPAADWAHSAARGVLANLSDRRGIKQALDLRSDDPASDDETSAEIVQTLAAIIRAARALIPEAKETRDGG